MPVPFSLDTAPLAPVPQAGERALVIAPHPDDESLGCGGWIYTARQRGAEVRILFLTDGDAFRLAAWKSERSLPSRAACLALGRRRRVEARVAAAALGAAETSLRFLGFPDRGLAELRRSEASKLPYRSPYTGRFATDETDGAHARRFLAEELRASLIGQFDEFNPLYVLTCDPADDHADHRATAAFTSEALARVETSRLPCWVGTYLIHHGLWPNPHRYLRDAKLTPPKRLRGGGRIWMRLPLSVEALRAKGAALSAHESQVPWAKPLFGAHQRTNELFCGTLGEKFFRVL